MTGEANHTDAAVISLIGRRSVSSKRMAHPGPAVAEIDLMLQAELRAPDCGGLHLWRVIEFREDQRASLDDVFEQKKLRGAIRWRVHWTSVVLVTTHCSRPC